VTPAGQAQGVAPSTSLDVLGTEMAALVARVRAGVARIGRGGPGLGAGVVWRADGHVLTNRHVVAGRGPSVEVRLADGRAYRARVTASDPGLDLALLKVEARDLVALPVGDSSRLRVGEIVFAVGHPWGRPWAVTAGIVSGLGPIRLTGRITLPEGIRSDVRLAPGHSGGPLVNARGDVVGVTTMILGGDLAVAIPSHIVRRWPAAAP
jgi:serine protease Do